MRCRPSCARRSSGTGRRCTWRCAPDLGMKELIAKSLGAEEANSPCRISCARPSVSHRLRSACCRRRPRHPAVARVAVTGRSCQPDQRSPDRPHRCRADRARDFHRGRVAFSELDDDFMLRRLPGVSLPAKCWIGKRRPAAICCRRRSRQLVIPREGGVSSTPRPLGSIADVSGILDHPPPRVMTAVALWRARAPTPPSPSHPGSRATPVPASAACRYA